MKVSQVILMGCLVWKLVPKKTLHIIRPLLLPDGKPRMADGL